MDNRIKDRSGLQLESATEELNHPLKAPSCTLSKNNLQSLETDLRLESVSNLETFIKKSIVNLKSKQEVYELDWEFIDGKNKEDFKILVLNLDKDSTESFYRHTLSIVDKVARLFHDILVQDMASSLREPDASICNQCVDLLVSYLGIILKRNQAFPPVCCLYRMIQDLDIDVRLNWRYLMDKMAECNGQSTNLNNKYQSLQCSKCNLQKCYGRYSDVIGKAKYVGAKYDDIIFGEKRRSPRVSMGENSKVSAGKVGSVVPAQRSISSFPELTQAILDKQIDASGNLLVSQAGFVRYCDNKGFFKPCNRREDWSRIDGMLTNKKGSKLSAKMLAQAYQDSVKIGKS